MPIIAMAARFAQCDRFLIVVQFDCHSEQAAFAPRGIWASRALPRVLCDATIARLARFLTKLHHTQFPPPP